MKDLPMRNIGCGKFQFIALITEYNGNNEKRNEYCSLGIIVNNCQSSMNIISDYNVRNER